MATERSVENRDQDPFAEPESFLPQRIRARRQPRWIAAGVLMIVLGGLGAALLWSRATHTSQVVIAQRTIGRGEVLRPSDFRVVEVGQLAGTSAMPGSAISTVEGKRALVDLMAGALVPEGAVGTSTLEKGSSQVGLKLAPGRVPNGELSQGTPVRLVALDDPRTQPAQQSSTQSTAQSGSQTQSQSSSQQGSSATPQTIPAVVLSPPHPAPDGTSTLIDVRVETQAAGQVALLAASDRLALVKDGGR